MSEEKKVNEDLGKLRSYQMTPNFTWVDNSVPIVEMKYMLFSGYYYYPNGGWEDFKGFFDSVEDAMVFLKKNYPEPYDSWAHIVKEGKIIKSLGSDPIKNEWF